MKKTDAEKLGLVKRKPKPAPQARVTGKAEGSLPKITRYPPGAYSPLRFKRAGDE